MQSDLCSAPPPPTPRERVFNFDWRSLLGRSLSSWLVQSGPVLPRRFVRNKSPSLVDTLELLEANPNFAHIRFPDGRESTISVTDLASLPSPSEVDSNNDNHEVPHSAPDALLLQDNKNEQSELDHSTLPTI